MEKLTKRDYYNEIIKLANENNRNDIVEFANHEIELLDRKKSNGKAKVNETMNANIELVYNELLRVGKSTTTELISKGNLSPLANEFNVITTQKVSAYLNKLYNEKRVDKVVEKKKTYFFVIEE